MDFEGSAEDVETLIAESGVHRPVLVGHSMGGMVAQTALRRRPDGYAPRCSPAPARPSATPMATFQRKFVADRLGPLDAGKTMADLAPRLVDRMIGPQPTRRARSRNRSDGRGAGRHLPRRGALPRRLRRARQPGAASAFPCCAWPARRTQTPRRRWWSAWPARSPAPATCASQASGHLPNLEAPAAFDAAVLGFLQQARSHP